jgi:DNA-binding NtrC family response regulator
MANILIVDDEKNLRRSLSIGLEEMGYKTFEAANGEIALSLIEKEVFDVVLTDLIMENMDGISLLRRIREISPSSEVLLMSAHGTISKAVEAIHEGAYDFIVKPFSMNHLEMVLKKLLSQVELKRTVKHLKAVLVTQYPFHDVVAVSPLMREVMHRVSLIAGSSVPVLIQGESGVGKELVALAIHHLSERSEKPFIPINCGAFPDTLLDSELFGHCKGSFTGAVVNKRGLIEEADGGTLLLDEIGEAPAALQVRLLRFLDNGRFRRIGEVVERKSDVRIVAATNRDLNRDIGDAKFREDLYYRLSVAVISVPPLRDRKEDISALSQRFLEINCLKMRRPVVRLHPEVNTIFQNYSWPGNVRELQNTIEHALILAQGDEIRQIHLPVKYQKNQNEMDTIFANTDTSLHEVEKKYILDVLKKTKGNKKRASEILKISRTTLISKLKLFDETESDSAVS